MMSHNCTIVVPCYNEAARLDVNAFREFASRNRPIKFLCVNDGSSDDTLEVLQSMCDSDPNRFAVCDLAQNGGKAEAIRNGVLLALKDDPEMVGFWDADLATPLDIIPEFCDVLARNPKLQMVFGARVKLLGRNIQRRPLRHHLGRVFATVASSVLRLPIYDTQCGAKLFRTSPEIRNIFEQPFRTNWIFDVELLARCRCACKAGRLEPLEEIIYELPLHQWRDVAGSKVKPHDFFKAFFELVLVYWTYLRPGAAPLSPLQRDDVIRRRAA